MGVAHINAADCDAGANSLLDDHGKLEEGEAQHYKEGKCCERLDGSQVIPQQHVHAEGGDGDECGDCLKQQRVGCRHLEPLPQHLRLFWFLSMYKKRGSLELFVGG